MKTIALTTALVAALAAPAFASDSLARNLGVEPGAYTTAELIQLRQAIEDNDAVTTNFILNGHRNAVDVETVAAFVIRNAEEAGDYHQVSYLENAGSEIVSSQGNGHNARAASIFAVLAEED